MKLFVNLLFGHALADYGLQTSYIAIEKKRNVWILLIHCFIHGFTVTYVLKSERVKSPVAWGLAEVAAHFLIDSLKNKGRTCEATDQILHIICKVLISIFARNK